MRFCLRALRARVTAGEHGQVLIEFAFVAIAFLILVFGIMDFGNALRVNNQLQNAVRDGARYASIHDDDSNLANDVVNQVNLRAGNLGLPTTYSTSCSRNCITICYTLTGNTNCQSQPPTTIAASNCPSSSSSPCGGPCQSTCGSCATVVSGVCQPDAADTCSQAGGASGIQPEVSVTVSYTLGSLSGFFPHIPFGTVQPSWTVFDEC